MNLMELSNGVVHADAVDGHDYTLCGLTASLVLDDESEYTSEKQATENVEISPYMVRTDRKIDCQQCATIIRHCCKLGTKAIKKVEAK